MTALHDIPGTHVDTVPFDPIASSAATNYVAVWIAPFRCKVTAIKVVCTDAVTGANTNTVHFNADGPSATTEIGNLDLTSGVDLTAGVPRALTMAASVNFAAGESLRLEQEEIGTGLGAAIDYGALVVEFEGR